LESAANTLVLETLRHNTWATKRLLAFCRGLSDDQLASAGVGTYGGILATFHHIIRADAGYVSRIIGIPRSALASSESADFDVLDTAVDETAGLWEQYLAQPVDADQLLILGEGDYEAPASVLVAQAVHHGNAHREQICSILTGLGIEPPDIQAWAWADATGRGRERTPDG
jgi:uncharacterized damage-inducible protein DinB